HRRWNRFDVAEQGVRPFLLIELASPHTHTLDVETKVIHYHRARVPHYVVVDEEREGAPLRVLGYRYTPERYVAVPPDGQGRVLLERLGLRLGVRGLHVVLFDAATDRELPDYLNLCLALEAATRARREAQERAAVERAQAVANASRTVKEP